MASERIPVPAGSRTPVVQPLS